MLKEFDKRLQHDKLTARIREESAAAAAAPAMPVEPESSTRPAKTFSSIMKQNTACEEFDNLKSFFTSLRGQGWKNNKRWESSPDRQGILPSRFGVVFKVTKDASGEPVSQRVEEIDLSENHINGELPSDLCFSGLRRLVLKTNHISRSIPTSIGNLHSLEVIDLSYNNLSGPIPESISGKNLPVLQILHLNDNRLSSSIPESLGSIKSLIELKLSHNLFSGPIPKQLSALSQLKYLDLCLNQIEGELPELFGAYFREMRYLDLSSNLLDGSLPLSFSSMNQLTYLDISQNQFKSGINLNKTIMGKYAYTLLIFTNLFEKYV
jgi:Leucine-rich repeat (LRR) protein